MNILVVGGTGFIGFHVVNELMANGHKVSILCRDIYKSNRLFGDFVPAISADLDFFHDIDFKTIFNDIEVVIYATGADSRQPESQNNYQHFYQHNVNTCIQFLDKARQHGVRQAIILGSYFTYLDQNFQDLQLRDKHPYIKSRYEQKHKSLDLSKRDFTVNVLELPYVFGFTPLSFPTWQKLINYVRFTNPIITTQGGINIISVQSVAKAIQGTITQSINSNGLVIGDENVSWKELFSMIQSAIGSKKQSLNYFSEMKLASNFTNGEFIQRLFGLYSGFNKQAVNDIITRDCFIDTQYAKQELHYLGGDIQTSLDDMIQQYPVPKIVEQTQRSLNWTQDFIKGFNARIKEMKKT